MVKTITFDAVEIQGGNLWIDPGEAKPQVEVHYRVAASSEGTRMSKSRQVTELLGQEDLTTLLALVGKLKATLEQEELG